jgi:hypothetical protein
MIPTYQYKEKYNINDLLYHSTNSDLLFEGLEFPNPKSPAYLSFSKGFANRNIIDFHPNKIGPRRIITYSLKKFPVLYNIDKDGIDLNEIKLFFQKKGLLFDERANDDFKRSEDITYDSILKIFGKKFSPIIAKYFTDYDGLMENNMLILFHPEEFLEIKSVENVDKNYLALMDLLNLINESTNIYESTLKKISEKYGIDDMNSIKYLLISNASKINTELPNVQFINKIVKL